MVNIVIVGNGDIAIKRHIPGIKRTHQARLYGFYNRNVKKMEAAAAMEPDCTCYYSAEELWNDKQVDAVIIATPTPSHYSLTLEALQAGKHVLCEKPLALTLIEAEAMVKVARHNHRKLMVAHIQRLYAPHIKAKELLDQGEIGELLSYRSFLGVDGVPKDVNTQSFDPWKDAVSELASHRIDLMRYITGAEVTRVFGHLTKLSEVYRQSGTANDDNATCILEYENGVSGTIIASRTSNNGNDRMTMLFGTKGSITTYGERHGVILEKSDGCRQYHFPDEPPQKQLEITSIHHLFCQCIEEDTTPFISGEDGLEVIRIIDALIRSNQEGTWVSLS